MKIKTFFSCITILALGGLAFAQEEDDPIIREKHQGFRSMIDNGNIAAAISLRKSGVTDIYCPATLSYDDAAKLYEDEIKKEPQLLIDSCSREFTETIGLTACSDSNSVELCKKILVATPLDKWEPLLDKIIEQKLFKSESPESPSFTKEMNFGFSKEFRKIQSIPLRNNWTQPMLMDKMKTVAQTATSETVADNEYTFFLDNGDYSQDAEDAAAVSLYPSKKGNRFESGCLADISCATEKIAARFVEYSDVPDDMGLFFCHLYPQIDKKISKEKGFDILNCKELFAAYSSVCSEKNEGEKRNVNLDARIFQCQKNDKGWEWTPIGTKIGKTVWSLINVGQDDERKKKLPNFMGSEYSYKKAQSICPAGWELPSKAQYEELQKIAGEKLAWGDAYYKKNPSNPDKWKFNLGTKLSTWAGAYPYVIWLSDSSLARFKVEKLCYDEVHCDEASVTYKTTTDRWQEGDFDYRTDEKIDYDSKKRYDEAAKMYRYYAKDYYDNYFKTHEVYEKHLENVKKSVKEQAKKLQQEAAEEMKIFAAKKPRDGALVRCVMKK